MRFNRRLALFLRYYLGCLFYGTLLLFVLYSNSFILAIIGWFLFGGFIPFGISYRIQGKVLEDRTKLLDILWLSLGIVTGIISNIIVIVFLLGATLVSLFIEISNNIGVFLSFSYCILGLIQLLQIRYIIRFAKYKRNYIQNKGNYIYE